MSEGARFGIGPTGATAVVMPKWESPGDAGERLFWTAALQWGRLQKSNCYVTAWDKGEDAALNDATLRLEIEAAEATRVVAVGREAAAAFGCPPMDQGHGLVFDFTGVPVIPVFHAAAALKDSKRLAWTVNDLKTVARQAEGKAQPWQPDNFPRHFERWTGQWPTHGKPSLVTIDTEYEGATPLCLTFSYAPGAAYLIGADEPGKLIRFNRLLAEARPVIGLHNALADIEPLLALGVDVLNASQIMDTMVYAWYEETERQSLKTLAYRKLGVDRPDFHDVVGPHYAEKLKAYMTGAKILTTPKTFERRGKPTKAHPEGKILKPGVETSSPLHRLANRFLGDLAKGTIEDFEKRWDGWDAKYKAELEQLCGAPPVYSLRGVPDKDLIPYACADAEDTWRLASLEIVKPEAPRVAEKDHRKIPMIAAMQARGMRVDTFARTALLEDLDRDLAAKQEELREMTGMEDFNPNSPIHVAQVLYGYFEDEAGVGRFLDDKEYLQVDSQAWTKAGRPKTDKKTLARIKGNSKIPAVLMAYKEREKIRGTYVAPLLDFCRLDADGVPVLHPTFAHTRVPSGRLAARRPNMMAIPSRTELGKRVRGLFVARPGFQFVGFDHSQIELCVAAEISNDRAMIDTLKSGRDFHAATASQISGRSYEDCLKDKLFRGLFKTINYGILFGATEHRIHMELLASGVTTYSLEDCKEAREDWFRLYSGVAQNIKDTEQEVFHTGYSTDMWGRRRYLPAGQLHGYGYPFSMLRSEAYRQGFNLKVQGGAQGLLINAMIGFWEQDLPKFEHVYPVLQVHDELIFEVEDSEVDSFKAAGLRRMQADQVNFDVPIVASCSSADRWSGLK